MMADDPTIAGIRQTLHVRIASDKHIGFSLLIGPNDVGRYDNM